MSHFNCAIWGQATVLLGVVVAAAYGETLGCALGFGSGILLGLYALHCDNRTN